MNVSLFSDWIEDRQFGEGSLAHLMAEIVDDAMARDTPGEFSPSENVDEGLLSSAWGTAQNEDPLVRLRTAVVLGRLGFAEVQGGLKDARHCGDKSLVRAAAIVLARLCGIDDERLEVLIQTVEDPTESREMRSAAARAVARVNQLPTTMSLVRIARADDPDLSQYGIEALGLVRPAAGSEEHAATLKVLLDTLKSKDPMLRLVAAEALGNLGDDAAVPELEKILIEKDPSSRRRALFALAKLGAESAKPPLTRMVKDFSIPARWEVVDLLGACYGEEMVEALEAAAADNDAEIRDHVVTALAKLDGPASLALLRKIASSDADSFVRDQALAALTSRDAELVAESPAPEAEPAPEPERETFGAPPPPPPSAPPPPPVPPGLPSAATGRVSKLRPLHGGPAPEPLVKEEPTRVVERALEAMECQWTLDTQGYQVEVPLAGRTEKVAILLGERDYEESPVYRFAVSCGPADAAAYEAALRNNRDLEYGALAVVDEHEGAAFVLTDTLLAGSATVAGVRKILTSLATAAGHLRG